MTDTERNLLWAVCRDPADDTVRLALADYLDEQGRARQAELVRVQVEIARTKPLDVITRPVRTDSSGGTIVDQLVVGYRWPDEYHRLCGRLTALWRGFDVLDCPEDHFGPIWKGWWLSPYPASGARESGHLTRGFVSEIALNWADWELHHEKLFWPAEVACPECLGTPEKVSRWRTAEMDRDEYGTSTTWCSHCKQTGFVPNPRPFRGTEQPLTRVTFTDWPGVPVDDVLDAEAAAMGGRDLVWSAILGKLRKRWRGLEFVPPPAPEPLTPEEADLPDEFDPVGDGYDDE